MGNFLSNQRNKIIKKNNEIKKFQNNIINKKHRLIIDILTQKDQINNLYNNYKYNITIDVLIILII